MHRVGRVVEAETIGAIPVGHTGENLPFVAGEFFRRHEFRRIGAICRGQVDEDSAASFVAFIIGQRLAAFERAVGHGRNAHDSAFSIDRHTVITTGDIAVLNMSKAQLCAAVRAEIFDAADLASAIAPQHEVLAGNLAGQRFAGFQLNRRGDGHPEPPETEVDIVVDPVTAFCGGKFDNDSVTSVRHLTTKLNDLADSTGVAIIALQHLTKSENPKLKNCILGSGAWVHGPRIVLGAVHTQENDRLFGKIKANVTDTYGVYPFSIESVDIQDIGGVRRIDWADEAWCNDQLSDHEGGLRVPDSKSQLAYDILRESLSDGQWHLRDFLMQRILTIVEVSESTVKRMAQELGVEKRRISDVPPQTEWRLSKQSIPGHNI